MLLQKRSICILPVAIGAALTWSAGGTQGNTPRADLYGDDIPADAIARLGTVRFRHGDGAGLNWLAFALDGKSLLGGDGGDVYVWEPATGRRILRMRMAPPSDTFAISADRRVLAVWLPDAQLHFYNLISGAPLGTLPGSKLLPGDCLPGQCLALSADGSFLASSNNSGKIHVYETRTARVVYHKQLQSTARWLFLTPDGSQLIFKSGNDLPRLVDIASGAELRSLGKANEGVTVATLSADGRTLALRAAE